MNTSSSPAAETTTLATLSALTGKQATICLYGAGPYGWLADTNIPGVVARLGDGGDRGDGIAYKFSSVTEAIWSAQEEIRRALVTGGVKFGTPVDVTVYLPGGSKCATLSLFDTKYAGDLAWVVAPQIEVRVA